MNNEIQKNKIINSLIWKFTERISAQAITFFVSIILARLLNPNDYGVIAIVLIFMNIADVFANAGFGSALIQKKNADNLDFSTVFYFNICFSVIIYLIIYIFSPYIAHFFNLPILIETLNISALRIPIAAINSVQYAYISRNMQFRKFFLGTLSGTIVSAFIGIIMAYQGYGIWALIGQYLSNAVVNTMVLFVLIKWHPQMIFSLKRLKSLFDYGWKILVSNLIDSGYASLNSLLIGKFYMPIDLAYFDTGKKFPMVIINNINITINSVLFPALASEQDEPEKVKAHTRKAIQIGSYIMWPIMLGMAACAENIVSLVLTDKWLPTVPYLQIACVTYGLWALHTISLQGIKAIGRSDILLKLEVIKKVTGIIALLIALQYGVVAIAYSTMVATIVAIVINIYPNKYLFEYSYIEQFKDVAYSFLLSFIVAIVIYNVTLPVNILWLNLFLKIIFAIFIYFILSNIFKISAYKYFLDYLVKMRRKERT